MERRLRSPKLRGSATTTTTTGFVRSAGTPSLRALQQASGESNTTTNDETQIYIFASIVGVCVLWLVYRVLQDYVLPYFWVKRSFRIQKEKLSDKLKRPELDNMDKPRLKPSRESVRSLNLDDLEKLTNNSKKGADQNHTRASDNKPREPPKSRGVGRNKSFDTGFLFKGKKQDTAARQGGSANQTKTTTTTTDTKPREPPKSRGVGRNKSFDTRFLFKGTKAEGGTRGVARNKSSDIKDAKRTTTNGSVPKGGRAEPKTRGVSRFKSFDAAVLAASRKKDSPIRPEKNPSKPPSRSSSQSLKPPLSKRSSGKGGMNSNLDQIPKMPMSRRTNNGADETRIRGVSRNKSFDVAKMASTHADLIGVSPKTSRKDATKKRRSSKSSKTSNTSKSTTASASKSPAKKPKRNKQSSGTPPKRSASSQRPSSAKSPTRKDPSTPPSKSPKKSPDSAKSPGRSTKNKGGIGPAKSASSTEKPGSKGSRKSTSSKKKSSGGEDKKKKKQRQSKSSRKSSNPV